MEQSNLIDADDCRRATDALARVGDKIATAEGRDVKMAERIRLHQARRGREWTTRGEPMALVKVLRERDGDTPRLVDCLTL